MADYINKNEVLNLIMHNDKVCHYADERYENVVYATARTICKVVADMPAADVQLVDRWISCQDKMPEEYKTVLVYEKDYGVMVGELEKKFFDTQYFIARKSGLILQTTEVTHWQPLPDPPVNL